MAGIVSNFLHNNVYVGDEINLLAPAGDFFFKDEQKPVVLLSAGVGIVISRRRYYTNAIDDGTIVSAEISTTGTLFTCL